MLITFQEKEYEFDLEALDLSEARYIKKLTGFTIRGLMNGLQEVDPDAVVAAYWLMLKQNGQVVDMHKVNFPVLKFAEALNDAFKAEGVAQDEENPTEGAPETAPAAT